jgi:hypothetical protein
VSYDDYLDDLERQRAGEVAADRLDLRLWALVKGEQRAEARTRRHPLGLELVVTVDGDLLTAEVFRPAEVDRIETVAERHRLAFERDGWTLPGPRG